MLNYYSKRKGEWLELDMDGIIHDPAYSAPSNELAQPRAGSHPHLVRQWLLAHSFFPQKWINRIFSVGGIRWQNDRIQLLTFPTVNMSKDKLYSSAQRSQGSQIPPILYEDDYCLVINKPAGMPVHASFVGQSGTLDEAVARHMINRNDPLPVRHIHRLDDDTSGPVLYSKNDLAQLRLDEAMRDKLIDRIYIAVVQGRVKNNSGVIDAAIGKDRHHSMKRRVTPNGDSAITHYEVVERSGDLTVVRVQLETGRTHQIRVHMSHIGHPLAGDKLYGGSSRLLDHQALHGERLQFHHPLSGSPIDVLASWPVWLKKLSGIVRP
ncbi:RluA family pseudouridine synthase [Paenibacillus sp. GSMTC-2017]|uniref:RluA family pseudouridine synthase n=1 Tax=Paenibacillus sp. GSMTC-2017 TaxID=2794350 RepID=UPI001E56DDB7|nr:RluA family pseudouridine synthase [Paenibacillus sp. GSMTC-2017]